MFNKQFSLPKKLTPETDITPTLSFYTPSQESISPYCSLYISHSTDKEYLDISHKLLWLVSNFIILLTFSDSVRRNELLTTLRGQRVNSIQTIMTFCPFSDTLQQFKRVTKIYAKSLEMPFLSKCEFLSWRNKWNC